MRMTTHMRSLNEAEAAQVSVTPRVDAVGGGKIRFSYQFAVEITELAKTLEQELTAATARIKRLETIAARRDRITVVDSATDDLAALSNDEVYERLKRYRCFGMTTRQRPTIEISQ